MKALLILVLITGVLCTAIASAHPGALLAVDIRPNLDDARERGFCILAGHPPFTIDLYADVNGGQGTLSYVWDLDGDGVIDSVSPDPEPFVLDRAGEYQASVNICDEAGQEASSMQRFVVIAPLDLSEWKYGVTAHLNRSYGLYQSDADVERAARMICDIGIDIVRFDLTWQAVQPTRTTHQWGDYDALVDVAHGFGLDLMPIIGFSAEWASTAEKSAAWEDWFFAAPDSREYAWFAYQAASRYAGRIPAWEIWNEPNAGIYWRPEPDPAVYTSLLRDAYLAIKYADPAAIVVLGGLGNDESLYQPQYIWYPPEEFLQAVYDNGGGDYFDAVGRHPYTHPAEGTKAFVDRLNSLRSIMVVNGDVEKPIWLTEFGYSSMQTANVSDILQGAWLAQCLDAAVSLEYVQSAFWYNFRNSGRSENDWNSNYGLVDFDWMLKPAYEAYRTFITNHE